MRGNHIGRAWRLLPLLLVFVAGLMAQSVAAYTWQAQAGAAALERGWRAYLDAVETHTLAPELPFESCFEQAAQTTELPMTLLQAVARGESDFNAKAVSSAGALGVMQVLWPGTARDLGLRTRSQAFDACQNIDAGARYLAQMLERYSNNLHLALIAYNRGPANVDRLLRTDKINQFSWYSGYIWDHLGFVLDRAQRSSVTQYDSEQRMVFIQFRMPFRAQELVELLRQRAPTLRFDWFKQPTGNFAVALHYDNSAQHRQGRRVLQQLGLMARE